MFTGKTLAEIALMLEASPEITDLVRAELTARINRPNARPSSVKRATAALARLDSGASVAIPAPAPKAPKAKTGNPNTAPSAAALKAKVTQAGTSGATQMSPTLAFAFVAKALKAGGHPVPRALSKAARTGTVAPKVSA